MSTAIFVALQCCQCSTMQVKQRKKSSNKWTCVVCNQKQSVLRVFAQGPIAKDVRKFVQSFNMSRKFSDQNQPFDSEYDINFEDENDGGGGGLPENPKKRRTDWTEYLDSEDRVEPETVLQEEEQGVDLEPEIVTELPAKEKFKRPELRNYDNGEGSNHHQLYKPVLSKRSGRKDTVLLAQDGRQLRQQQALGDIATSASKRSSFTLRDAANIVDSMRKIKPTTATTAAAKGNSKWSLYMTEDEEEQSCPTNPAHYVNKWGDGDDNTESIKCQIVEDEIHPDFI
ncbi:MRN complex-interacting protein-like [Hibiscus syriacus]|uniref:MRN complex-interacting protein-like n=1 Tax=Hibiscus syriacus TaxID=106335 RepID=UPI0019236CCD|nr:MRN complex-interacting protein-like [Hibiscus syriacus]